jgi:hypothetical protein
VTICPECLTPTPTECASYPCDQEHCVRCYDHPPDPDWVLADAQAIRDALADARLWLVFLLSVTRKQPAMHAGVIRVEQLVGQALDTTLLTAIGPEVVNCSPSKEEVSL